MSEPTTHDTNNPLAICKPLADRAVIRRHQAPKKTAGGILLPDSTTGKPQTGTVLSVGPGRRDRDGQLVPMDLKVGDMVLITNYAGLEIRDPSVDHEQEYTILREEDVLATLPNSYVPPADRV